MHCDALRAGTASRSGGGARMRPARRTSGRMIGREEEIMSFCAACAQEYGGLAGICQALAREGTHFLEAIQGTFHPAAARAQNVRVNHRGRDIVMSEQLLNRPDVCPALQGVGRKAVAKGVAA